MLITADHGNAEKMRGETGACGAEEAHTAHTSNLVPLVYLGRKAELSATGTLSDIAPTMLALMELPQPAEMTGHNLVRLQAAAQHAA
jgi:2,3-bisphosphoglycerate-independent phosphoglycerate mutase